MKLVILTVLSIILFQQVVSEEDLVHTCEEMSNPLYLSLLYKLSNKQLIKDINFHLGVKNDNNSLIIGHGTWSALTSEHFKPSQKTVIIIHGYRSSHQKRWVRELKDKLLEHRKINLILVDWKTGSNKWNYVNSVMFASKLKYEIVGFLNDLKKEVKKAYHSIDGDWKKLYFIGHSLGAHVSGQTAHLIRSSKDGFYQVERITGLDPAQPCFSQVNDIFKLDKTDADFVDIIHTQTGTGKDIYGLGLKESIGHIDFYVNGGVHQSECLEPTWTTMFNRMICSHKKACTYFIESIGSLESKKCNFVGHKWNQTHADALRILKDVGKGVTCTNCPKMGIECSKNSGSGSYLVLTTTKQPRCSAYEKNELKKLKIAIDTLIAKK